MSDVHNAFFIVISEYVYHYHDTIMMSWCALYLLSGMTIYEITMYVDHNGTFYQACSIEDRPYQVTKGHIEGDTLVYQGLRTIEEGDHFEYLSDIPDDMYEDANTFYLIDRTSENTLTLKTSNGVGTKYDFIRVDE